MLWNTYAQMNSNFTQLQTQPSQRIPTYGKYTASSNATENSVPSGDSEITIHICGNNGGSYGTIYLDGTDYYNGQTIVLPEYTNYQIYPASISKGMLFSQWLVTGGTVADNTSSSTSFDPTQSSSVLVLILHYTSGNWGGYVVQGSNGLTDANVQFVVPGAQYFSGVQGAASSEELVGFWVGIGGIGGNLWQAGVSIQMNNSNSVWYYAWYEYVGTPSINPVPVFNVHPGDWH